VWQEFEKSHRIVLGETSLLTAGSAALLVPSSHHDNQKHSYISTVPLETVAFVENLYVE